MTAFASPPGTPVSETPFDLEDALAAVRRAFAALVDEPLVSVVVPVFDRFAATVRCLASIASARDETPFEVIVADDASRDETAAVLGAVAGLHVSTSPRNMGFVRNCNRAAGAARGRYLMLLNNDTWVLPGWLDALVATFEAHPDCGLAGSMLLFPDGTLQEAGATLRHDGTVDNIGRGASSSDPRYAVLRDVDYVSAAAVMVPADLWRRLGGFDERYAPAYYEDVDLAYRIRACGLRTLYQPASRVIHWEGLSHGSGDRARRLIEANRPVFVARWRQQLPPRPAMPKRWIDWASRRLRGVWARLRSR
jgi:GT2 family glycosyltransferase